MVEIIILLTTNGIKVDLWQRNGLKKLARLVMVIALIVNITGKRGDESGCKLDDFESEDADREMTEELKQKAKKWVKENACDWCVNADECG